jgi:putative hemolysin
LLGLTLEVAIVFALIAFNGLLALSELALVSARRIRLQQRAERGSAGAATALDLAQEPTRFLSTVQIGITLVGILAGAFGGASIAGRLDGWLEDAGVSSSLSGTLSVFLVVLAITYLSLVFGELVPKRVALQHPESIAAVISRPMRLLAQVSAPFVAVLSASTQAVLKLLRLPEAPESSMTDEEIRLLIGESAESGSVREEEAQLLDRVFHFGDRQVHEVMVPRTDTVFLPHDSTIRDFYSVYASTPHSRFPVFEETPDRVIGILGIKDVLAALAARRAGEDAPITPLLRQPYFIPETKLIGELLRELQGSGIQMAIAIDEFGGMAGIVTLEQLLEEMVGPLHDEVRAARLEVQPIDERTTRVDGNLSVEEAREQLGLDIPDGPYDTIAGFVMSTLGRIPEEGEQVDLVDYNITVTEMRGPKIEMLQVTRS